MRQKRALKALASFLRSAFSRSAGEGVGPTVSGRIGLTTFGTRAAMSTNRTGGLNVRSPGGRDRITAVDEP